MKGGIPTKPQAIRLNSIVLCAYQKLLIKHRAGKMTTSQLKTQAENLMLYRIDFTEDHPEDYLEKKQYLVSDYPNPMSIQAIIDSHETDLQFLYVDGRVNCSGTVI
jgi:hypothetical protein